MTSEVLCETDAGTLINDDSENSPTFSKVFDLNILVTFQIDYLVAYILVPNHDSSFAEKLRFFSSSFLDIFYQFFSTANRGQIVDIIQPMKSRGEEKVSHYKSVIDYNFDQFTSQINGVWLKKKVFVILVQNLLRSFVHLSLC